MPNCSFCKKSYHVHKGLTIFNIDGKSLFYCSSKCRKNANLGRDPKKVNWVRKGKELMKNFSSEKLESLKKSTT